MFKQCEIAVSAMAVMLSLTASAVADAQATQSVLTRDGNCQAMVPANWTLTPGFGTATSPDKMVTVVVNSPSHSSVLAQIKKNAGLIYTNDRITQNTSTEYQAEGLSIDNKPNVYRAIQLSGKVCVVEVVYESGTKDDAREIAQTLNSAK